MSKGIVINGSQNVSIRDSSFTGLETAIEANNVSNLEVKNIKVFDRDSFLILKEQLLVEIENTALDTATKVRLKSSIDKSFQHNKVNKKEASRSGKILKFASDKAFDIFSQMMTMIAMQ
jgi:hypothetical protein